MRFWLRSVGLAGALLLTAASPKVNEPAPPFEIVTLDGTKIDSAALRGQVVVLNFWATWCGPCKKELPLLDSYYEARKKYGLKVFAITTEDSLPPYRLKKLFNALHITPIRRIKGYRDLGALPTNYVIGRAGRIRYAEKGAFDLDTLNRVLIPLLNEPAPKL